MIIRAFQTADTVQLHRLFRDTVRQINSRDYVPEQIAAWAPELRDLSAWQSRFAQSFTFVAENKGQILGFANIEPNGHIDMFYVHAGAQNRGVGTALLHELERKARELNLLRLDGHVSITAKPFFLKEGFSLVREQSVELRGQKLTNFVMEKALV